MAAQGAPTGTASKAAGAPQPSPAFSPPPFPDLTGLRQEAEVRRRSPVVSVQHDLGPIAGGRQGGGQEEALALAWPVLLSHLVPQEDIDLACHVMGRDEGQQRCLRLRVPAAARGSARASNLSQHLAHDQTARGVDTAITLELSQEAARALVVQGSYAVVIRQQGARLHIEASPKVLNRGSAALLFQQLEVLIDHLATPDASVPILSAEIFPTHLRAGANKLPPPSTLDVASPLEAELFQHQFERIAARHPEREALRFVSNLGSQGQTTSWTYAELDRRATLLAALLREAGIGQGNGAGDEDLQDVVALCLEKSPETYLAMLATLKAGAAWCPIDTDWPAARREALLAKCNAKTVLASGSHVCEELQKVLPAGVGVIRLDEVDWSVTPIQAPRASHGSNKLAYLIWTSGSTGLPKPVGIQHYAAVQALRSLQQVIPAGDASQLRYLQFSAYVFDLMIMDCFYAWGLGGTICSGPRHLLLNNLVQLANEVQATHTLLTPAIMAMTPRSRIPTLRVVINGGEKLSQVVADSWSVDCCLLNLYGPAEATLIAMHRRVPERDQVKAPNIGVPLPTVSCHVLSAQGEIAIRGATGELVLGGHQCAKGYIGEPEKTADKFQMHPELGRIYRTGDVSRVLWDGSFEYLGRNDDQIKVNGIRIELLEINSAIKNAHEGVRDSETMALPRRGRAEELQIVNVSILETEPSDEIGRIRDDAEAADIVKTLRTTARDTLPAYMVPSLFLVMTHFPKTSSAKVDRAAIRKALDAFDVSAWEEMLVDEGEEESAADEDTLRFEGAVREKLIVVCGLGGGEETSFTRHTPFMSLGLDSIKAIALSNALSDVGLEVGVLDLLRHASLAALSKALSSSRASEQSRLDRFARGLVTFKQRHGDELKHRLEGQPVSHVLPVTPLQHGMLVETQLNPRAYWLRRRFTLDGEVDFKRLGRAFETVVRSTEMLRAGFLSVEGDEGVAQVVHEASLPAIPEPVEIADEEDVDDALLREADRLSSRSVLDGLPPFGIVFARQRDTSYLVLVAHHSIYDAQSLSILTRAVKRAYDGEASVDAIPFRKALPYLTAVDEDEASARSRRWEELTADFPRGLDAELPSLLDEESDTAAKQKCRGLLARERRSQTTWPELQSACQRLAVSPRALLQAALARVLSVYCDSNAIVIGDSISLRGASASLATAFGPVLTTLPVPIMFKPGATRRQTMSDIAALHRGVLGFEHIPLPTLKRILGIDAASTLFQCAFVLELQEGVAAESTSFLSRWHDLVVDVEHPLALEVSPSAKTGDVELRLMFDDSRISMAWAETLLAQVDAMIGAFADRPDAEVSEEPAQPPELLSSFVSAPLPGQERLPPVHDAIASVASQHPSRTAIDFIDDLARPEATRRTVTYHELQQSVRAAGALLQRQNLKPKSVVAVSVPRSPELYTWLLATLACGHTYLPVDTTLPAERKRLLVEDSDAQLIVATSAYKDDFEGGAALLCVDDQATTASLASVDVSWPSVSPDDAAYILYTSGSTGKPKGCVLSHRNLSATLAAFQDTIERAAPGTLDAGLRWLARSSEAFDVHLLEALLPLQLGGTVCTAPREQILEDLRRAMQVLAVTHSAVVPSLFFSQGRRIVPDDLPLLRVLIVGGEKIAGDILRLWGPSHAKLLNAYGPSETCIGNSMAHVDQRSLTTLIGRPFAGTGYHVMAERERQLEHVLRGAPGELCISGLQLGSYLHSVPASGFVNTSSGPLYRTGDLVRMRPTGEVDYLGRIADSQQVKISGVRIELGEVDAAVRESLEPPLQDAMVSTQVISEGGRQQLVSFIAKTAATSASPPSLEPALAALCRQLQTRLREKLPTRLSPFVVALSHIPLIATSGKTDGKRLRELFAQLEPSALSGSRGGADNGESADWSESERKVADIVKRVLPSNETALSPSLDLFSAGLDSLSAVSLAAALRRAGLHVDASSIIRKPTIRAIAQSASPSDSAPREEVSRAAFAKRCAELLEACKEQNAAGTDLPLENVEAVLPCLPMQAALLAQSLSFKESSGKGPVPYIHSARYALGGSVDESKLQKAWLHTIEAHPIYRTVFAQTRSGFAQLIVKPGVLSLPWRVVEARSDEAAASRCGDEAAQDILRELETAPPLRLVLVKTEASRHLVVCAHHCIYDGVSWNLLLREVAQRYQGADAVARGAAFGDVVRFITEQDSAAAMQFWRDALAELTISPFPSLTGRRQLSSEPGARTERTSAALQVPLATLRASCRAKGVTLQSLALAAFCKLVALYTGEEGVTIGLVLSGRSHPVNGIADTHGPCITTVPFSLPEARQQDATEHVRAVQERVAVLLPYQHLPLTQIARAAGCEGMQLFNTLFSFLPGVEKAESSNAVILSEEESEMQTEYPIALELQEDEEANVLSCNFDVDPALVPRAQAKAMLAAFSGVVNRLAGEDAEGVAQVPLSVSNPAPYSPQEPSEGFVARFVKNARERPDAVAFVWADTLSSGGKPQPTTYAELDAQSDAIAERLAADKHEVAAVYLGRGPLLYATLLGVWKAGKVYMPLDPALPMQRLEYMLSVVRDAVIITEAASKSAIDGLGQETIFISTDDLKSTSARRSFETPALDQGAYILFTSGSTGRPKAARVSHQALAACIYSWERILPHKPWQSRMLQLASPGFDVSFIEICFPLAVGGSFGGAPKDELLDDIEAACTALGITQADLPASLAATVSPERMPPLEWLMSGGDLISDRTLSRWAPRGLINAWGPTEATIGNTLGFVDADSSRSMIGAPYPTSSLYVLDEQAPEILPQGAVGELCVGGCQLADGYVGQPQLTAEKFVYLADGTRVYRTGDRGRILSDGRIECLGRMQTGQVKVNGQRLELGEVSQSLRRYDGIEDVETLFLQHAQLGNKQLVSFVALTAAQGGADRKLTLSDDLELKGTCRAAVDAAAQELPRYMVPIHAFALTGSFPKTVNDKVDRKALASLFEDLPLAEMSRFDALADGQDGSEAVALNESERSLAELLSSFTGIPSQDMSRRTSLYELGIDSISGLQLVRHLREAGFQTSVQQLFRTPTIGKLAAALIGGDGEGDQRTSRMSAKVEELERVVDAKALRLSDSDQVRLLPCSPLQSGLVSQTLVSEGKLYVHPVLLRVKNVETEQAVWRAWQSVVDKLDILRTAFHFVDELGAWCQVVHWELECQATETSTFTTAQEAAATLTTRLELLDESAFARPPWAASLFKIDSELHFGLVLHHALYDANAITSLLRLFDDTLAGRDAQVGAPFKDLLPHLLSTDEDSAHWVELLRGYRSRSLPLLQRSEVDTVASAELQSDITAAIWEPACKRYGVSLSTLAQAVYARRLSALLHTPDVVFGTLVSLRDAFAGAQDVVGPALSTIPVRLRFRRSQQSFSDLARQLQAQTDEGRPFRQAALRDIEQGFREIQHADLALPALFDFQADRGADHPEVSTHHLELVELEDESGVQYPLNVLFILEQGRLKLVARSQAAALPQGELKQLLAWLAEDLARVCSEDVSACDVGAEQQLSQLWDDEVTPTESDEESTSERSSVTAVNAPDYVVDSVRSVVAEAVGSSPDSSLNHASFKSLGLDSIASIKIASRLRREGFKVGLADIVKCGSVLALASHIGATRSAQEGTLSSSKVSENELQLPDDVRLEIEKLGGKIERVLPTLPIQDFFLAESVTSRGTQGAFTLAFEAGDEKLKIDKLRQAWAALVKRHAILRTTFASVNRRLVQVVLSADSPAILSGSWADEVTAAGLSIEQAFKKRRSQQDACALVASCCFARSSQDGKASLLLQLPHACYDAWSMDLLLGDLQAIYLGQEPTSSADYSELALGLSQGRYGSSEPSQANLFARQLKGAQLWPSPSDEAPQDRAWTFIHAKGALRGLGCLEKAAREAGCDLQSLLIAAWAKTLRELSGQDLPTFGLYHLGRSVAFDGIERLAGPCMTVLPAVVQSKSDLVEEAKEVRAMLDSRAPFEHTSLAEVKRACSVSPRRPIVTSFLNLLWSTPAPMEIDAERTPLLRPATLPDECHLLRPDPASVPAVPKRLMGVDEAILNAAQDRLSVDMSARREADEIDVAIRADADVLPDDAAAKRVIERFAKIVVEAVGRQGR